MLKLLNCDTLAEKIGQNKMQNDTDPRPDLTLLQANDALVTAASSHQHQHYCITADLKHDFEALAGEDLLLLMQNLGKSVGVLFVVEQGLMQGPLFFWDLCLLVSNLFLHVFVGFLEHVAEEACKKKGNHVFRDEVVYYGLN